MPTIRSLWRGHPIEYRGGAWYYIDTDELVSGNPKRACRHCQKPNREDGDDPCLGHLPGVSNACCGHGEPIEAYIQFNNGVTVRGFDINKLEKP